jgi:peptidoglycan hydrolase-like protein with peptidoglycan-binding domain
MTATLRFGASRHARRLAVAALCVGTVAITATSTLAVAATGRPAADAPTTSVVGLREGDSGAGVQAVQQKLVGLGYYVAGGADGRFGAGTTAALRVFQRQNGLNPTGVVTENTARYLGLSGGVAAGGTAAAVQPAAAQPAAATAAAVAAPASVVGLRPGTTGQAVRQLQLAILATGLYLNGGADGTFGSSTQRGVRLVQRVNGLPETGVVDAATARVLGLTGSASSPSAPAPAGTVVQVGATGASVRRIQQLLIKAGVNVVGGADGVFGPQTRRSVAAFQALHGLPQTGRVDAATDAALAKAANRPATPTPPPTVSSGYVGLRAGSTGPAVVKLQQAIIATGLVVRGGADGVFGRQTRAALAIYQRVNGLAQTGVVDEATARLLGLLGSSSSGGGSQPAGGGSATNGYPSYDERGARVVALQRALLRAGISFSGGADGVFGSATAGAIMKFQRARGLRVTGKVDQATAIALGLQASPKPAPAPAVTIRMQARPIAKGPCWYGDTWHAFRGSGRVHLGVDIGAPRGTPLQAVVSGRVTQIYRDRPGSLSGNGIKIAMADGTYFFYAHLDTIAPGIGVGVPVAAGQVIGTIGSTGNAAITHLHFEVHPRGGAAVNPYPLVKAIGAC